MNLVPNQRSPSTLLYRSNDKIIFNCAESCLRMVTDFCCQAKQADALSPLSELEIRTASMLMSMLREQQRYENME